MTEIHACWDCGSVFLDRHTPLCELAPDGVKRDLPQAERTQYWTESLMGRAWSPGRSLLLDSITGIVLNSKTQKPGAGCFRGTRDT